MATVTQIADTLGQLGREFASRIDQCVADKSITTGAGECFSGILEWIGSVEEGMRNCDGVLTPVDPVHVFRAERMHELAATCSALIEAGQAPEWPPESWKTWDDAVSKATELIEQVSKIKKC